MYEFKPTRYGDLAGVTLVLREIDKGFVCLGNKETELPEIPTHVTVAGATYTLEIQERIQEGIYQCEYC